MIAQINIKIVRVAVRCESSVVAKAFLRCAPGCRKDIRPDKLVISIGDIKLSCMSVQSGVLHIFNVLRILAFCLVMYVIFTQYVVFVRSVYILLICDVSVGPIHLLVYLFASDCVLNIYLFIYLCKFYLFVYTYLYFYIYLFIYFLIIYLLTCLFIGYLWYLLSIVFVFVVTVLCACAYPSAPDADVL